MLTYSEAGEIYVTCAKCCDKMPVRAASLEVADCQSMAMNFRRVRGKRGASRQPKRVNGVLVSYYIEARRACLLVLVMFNSSSVVQQSNNLADIEFSHGISCAWGTNKFYSHTPNLVDL